VKEALKITMGNPLCVCGTIGTTSFATPGEIFSEFLAILIFKNSASIIIPGQSPKDWPEDTEAKQVA
jgi:hypothetical protein